MIYNFFLFHYKRRLGPYKHNEMHSFHQFLSHLMQWVDILQHIHDTIFVGSNNLQEKSLHKQMHPY